MYSTLCNMFIESFNRNPRKNSVYNPDGSVDGIIIHHTATVGVSAKDVARSFQNASRQASANYVIGNDGCVVCSVPEEFRAWTSGSREADYKKITIEVCNESGRPDWKISKAAYDALVNLCIDICRRHKIVPYFNNTKKASFTFHYMYQATECPGPYIKSHIYDIINQITYGLTGDQKPEPKPEPAEDVFFIRITCDVLNIRRGPSTRYKIVGSIKDKKKYTIVETSNGWGRLKSGAGWICLDYTKEVK